MSFEFLGKTFLGALENKSVRSDTGLKHLRFSTGTFLISIPFQLSGEGAESAVLTPMD